MFARNPPDLLRRWGRTSLLVTLLGLPLYASCTQSEDTEPYVPAQEGAKQPGAEGALLSETEACERLREAYESSYDKLECDLPEPPDCPDFIRPGGGSGCYEYYEDSVAACEKAFLAVSSCSGFVPCIASAKRNDELPSCVLPGTDAGGAGGQSAGGAEAGGALQGGASSASEGGAPAALGGASSDVVAGNGGAAL
jgi:hypothetical protein